MSLSLVPQSPDADTPESSAMYAVHGLQPGLSCYVGRDASNKWWAYLYDSGTKLADLGPAESPDEVLRMVEDRTTTTE